MRGVAGAAQGEATGHAGEAEDGDEAGASSLETTNGLYSCSAASTPVLVKWGPWLPCTIFTCSISLLCQSSRFKVDIVREQADLPHGQLHLQSWNS